MVLRHSGPSRPAEIENKTSLWFIEQSDRFRSHMNQQQKRGKEAPATAAHKDPHSLLTLFMKQRAADAH